MALNTFAIEPAGPAGTTSATGLALETSSASTLASATLASATLTVAVADSVAAGSASSLV